MEIILRYCLAMLMGLPVATMVAVEVSLCFGDKGLPNADEIIRGSFLVSWVGCTLWAGRATTSRESFRRACHAFSIAAFLLPVAAMVFVLTEPDDGDLIMPKWYIFVVAVVLGGLLGLLARFLTWTATRARV